MLREQKSNMIPVDTNSADRKSKNIHYETMFFGKTYLKIQNKLEQYSIY